MTRKQPYLWEELNIGVLESRTPTIHTSKSHPLNVDWLPAKVLPTCGALGMTFAPGKCHEKGVHGIHRRSLDVDLKRLVKAKTHVLVTLMEEAELVENGLGGLGQALSVHGLEWLHFPIRDLSIPTSITAVHRTIVLVVEFMHSGRNCTVHCRGGHGRTGLFVACLLTVVGYTPEAAIQRVRAARKGTLHNVQQEDFVMLYSNWVRESRST